MKENKDYSHLEGKELKIYSGSSKYKGIVDGCDYDIGITISDVNDKNYHYLCLNGPSSPLFHKNPLKTEENYKILFNFIVSEIKRGVCNMDAGKQIQKDIQPVVPDFLSKQAACPFNQ